MTLVINDMSVLLTADEFKDLALVNANLFVFMVTVLLLFSFWEQNHFCEL